MNRDDTPPQGYPVIQPPPPQPPNAQQHDQPSLKWWQRTWWAMGVPCVLVLLVIAVGSAPEDTDNELADAREQIEQERAQAREQMSNEKQALEKEKSNLESERAGLEDEIDRLKGQASKARSKARQERKKLSRLQQQVSGAEQQIEDNTIPGDGTFVVGDDIQPGTYKSEGQDDCYWARLSGLGGGVDDIIANDNTSGPVTIEVLSSDRALELSGCADFVRQGG